jgi:hypothetical protein
MINIPLLDWPKDAKFFHGDHVQRCNRPDGKPPPFRFPGIICGWYRLHEADPIGYAVAGDSEPGNKLIFPEYMLEQIK